MKRANTNSGKIIAVILILLFIGINFFKSLNEAGPQEKHFAQTKQARANEKKFTNNIAAPQNIEKLKFAYTGTWQPNQYQEHNLEGKYAFTAPENTRGKLDAVAATKKANEDAKKKKLAKKNKKTVKIAKKTNKKRSRFDKTDNLDYDKEMLVQANAYYTTPVPQEREPSEEDKEKKLTSKEWLEKILLQNSIEEFVTKYKEGKSVSQNMFYSVIEELLSSNQESIKKLGFQALAATPSGLSLAKYASHIDDSMSSALKIYAQNSLDAYYQPRYLRALNTSLNSKDDKLKILAATIIKSITSTIFQTQTTSGENVVYTAAQIESFKIMLIQSLNVIDNALETGLTAEVLASFNAAKSVLVQFLS